MTIPNTPAYIPSGVAPPVAWDPDDHIYKLLQLTSGSLAPHAATATRVYQTSGSQSTTSGSYTDIPGLVDTVVSGGPDAVTVDLLAILVLNCVHSTINAGSNAGFQLDGGADQFTGGGGFTAVANTLGFNMVAVALFQNIAPGSHTIKGRWQTSGGGTLFASSSRGFMVVVELRR
jgi:hypothetical protein